MRFLFLEGNFYVEDLFYVEDRFFFILEMGLIVFDMSIHPSAYNWCALVNWKRCHMVILWEFL